MEKQEKVQQKVTKAFLEMVKDTPVEKIQVKQLVQKAGISRSAFYVYYDSIWDVLQEVEDGLFRKTDTIKKPVYEGHDRDDKKVFHKVIDLIAESQETIEALSSRGGDEAYVARWRKNIVRQIEIWRGLPLAEDSIQTKIYAEFLKGGIPMMLSFWAKHVDELNRSEVYEMFDKIYDAVYSLFEG